jgi:hypothetical protein
MSIGNLLQQTITIYSKTSYGSDGRPAVGTGTEVSARFQPKQVRKPLPNGDVLVVDAIAYVPADTTIATDAKVTYDSVTYRVLNVYKTPDGKGNTKFIRLELAKWQI